MSFENFLNQTCTIARPTAAAADRYNQNKYSYTQIAADVRCRMVQRSVVAMDPKSSEYSWVNATVIFLPAGTSVHPKDRVTVDGHEYLVKNPLSRSMRNIEHHVSVVVEAINA